MKNKQYDPTSVADQFSSGMKTGVYINQWLIAGTKPGTVYTVSSRYDGGWECSCPRWIYHREDCKHIHAARLGKAFLTEGTQGDLHKLADKLKKEGRVNARPWEK